ncbi:MAG: hypothetical protein RMN51_13135 [Verrucomicrobiota bacterium]|nr:hypothetical protein [Limisphaera sp.]MDW8383039.1 hypothetical protein [Verrucomicrobiota bacterium]
MNGAFASLSSEQLRRAVAIKEKIEALEKELNAILEGAATGSSVTARRRPVRFGAKPLPEAAESLTASAPQLPVVRRKRRMISAEGRRRIIEAQRRRWAAWRAARKAEQKAQQK